MFLVRLGGARSRGRAFLFAFLGFGQLECLSQAQSARVEHKTGFPALTVRSALARLTYVSGAAPDTPLTPKT